MYALVEINSKQYKVEQGDKLLVDLQHYKEGDAIVFNSVLAVMDGSNAVFGTPYVNGARLEAVVLSEKVLSKKIRVYKYHRRKGYRKTQGHREGYTEILVNNIVY